MTLPPNKCGHDQHFREIMFCKNGCLACEYESTKGRLDDAVSILIDISGDAAFSGVGESLQNRVYMMIDRATR